MWKLKISEGRNPWLRTTNGHAGRQVWEFDPELGTAEEIEQIEKACEEFRKNRFKMKHSADIPLRLQAMQKLKISEGRNPWLRTTNDHVGRQVWKFCSELGTTEEIAQIEKAHKEF